MSIRHLDQLLEPRSVVVVGASNRTGSIGATVWRNLRAGSFAGPVFGVNPKHAAIDGVGIARCLAGLAEAPDLAVLCTPPATVPGLVDELGRLGTRAAIVMSTGLSAPQKQAALSAAAPHLLRLLGPNSLGLLSPRIGLNVSSAHTDALPGKLAFVSQSGTLVTAMLDWARSRSIGFSHLVSLGEHADVDFGDLLDHLASDAQTRSILLYIESIEAPRKFMSAARAAARNKPVIVVKAGRAGDGLRAAASHSGALAGSDVVIDAAIRRAGMLRVDNLQELFVAAETLAHFRGNPRQGLTLMTNAGGAGVMAADAAALAGIELTLLGESTLRRLDEVLPASWSRGNPVDIAGDAPAERYANTLRALLDDPGAGTVLFMHAPTAFVRSEDVARACVPLARKAAGRLVGCWLGDAGVAEARRIFEEAGVACYEAPEAAVRAFSMFASHQRNQALLTEAPTASEAPLPDRAAARAVVESALGSDREMLDELESKAVLKAYGIPVVPTVAAGPSADAAVSAARSIGYPVVLKILSPDISHKSDVGGVALDLGDESAVRLAAEHMLARVRLHKPAARIAGFTVQQMVLQRYAHELIVGASVDPVFGPVIVFGQGGSAVEVIDDRAVGLPPLNRVLARDLVSATRVAKLLAGYRQHPAARIEAVCDVLVAVSQMLADLPELAELDINPLLADGDGVIALDARLRVAPATGEGPERFAIPPYPCALAETWQWQGRQLLVRPIRPEDEALHLAFAMQLAPEDIRLRFFSMRRELPRSELARLVQIDYDREMAFIALESQADGSMRTVGVVRAVADPDNVEAEFAIILAAGVQGQGLGKRLLDIMVRYLKRHGTQRLVALVLRENRAMRELAIRNGFKLDAAGSDCTSLRYVLDLAPSLSSPA